VLAPLLRGPPLATPLPRPYHARPVRFSGVARDPFLTFVENTKESFAAAFTALDIRVPSRTWAINNLQMLLPQPPRRAVTWLEGRRRDAVRMVRTFARPVS